MRAHYFLDVSQPIYGTVEDNDLTQTTTLVMPAPKPLALIHRPSGDEPLVSLQQKVSSFLRQALEKGEEVKIGTSCKNGGCTKSFSGPGSNEEKCKHHPGVPNFHEGMKFWSCCRRKTSAFNGFLAQEGCTTGSHLWRKPDKGMKVVPCSFDWQQNGSQVIILVVF
ncbi:hypothetical protein J4Q44_G00326160 [Coregonus suidteri]|uniref:CHORD domain-containing protein n=1 Tax=Coregonus suidteri TaxID=861788 RepID=A0AAN8KWA6_9TELE